MAEVLESVGGEIRRFGSKARNGDGNGVSYLPKDISTLISKECPRYALAALAK